MTYPMPKWMVAAHDGDWLEAAKLALLDLGSASGTAQTCATIALTEALNKTFAANGPVEPR